MFNFQQADTPACNCVVGAHCPCGGGPQPNRLGEAAQGFRMLALIVGALMILATWKGSR